MNRTAMTTINFHKEIIQLVEEQQLQVDKIVGVIYKLSKAEQNDTIQKALEKINIYYEEEVQLLNELNELNRIINN